jgi:hypothetical protein
MRRWLRPLAFWLLLAFSLALYREWIVRTKSPLFIPLGFFESAVNVTSPEESVRDPATWNDPLEPVAIDIDEFDELVNREGATETKTDVLVTGATFGGFAAAIAAADGGVDVTFVLPDDWRGDMLGQAAAYAGQRHLPDTPTSPLERELRLWPSLQNRQANTNNANGLPSDIVDFFASRIASEKRVTMRDGYAIEAFGRNAEGKPTKALLRPNDGSAPLAVSFSYLIDGTQEGSTMALSGVATTSNWDETPEYDALAKGYTMSGRTMPGIGKRLDGARVAMGVVDRGYHGSFVAPTSVDDCWKPDVSKNPFVAGNAVLRAETIGCTASFSVTSSFEDTVEVFFVNHGNDSIAAAVTIDGTVFNIEMRADPSARFTRIGAFPVGADSPITVTIRNILPTDRLEGIVARKMNANQEATPFTLGEGENATFASSGWDRTDHDIYVHGDGQNAEVIVDGTPHAATPVGFDTFVARGVTLSPGTHELSLTGIEGLGAVLAVPTTPYRALQHIERPVPQTASWTFVPASDGIIAVLAPNESCQASCVMNLTESGGATISLRGDGSGVGGMISAVIPMGTASVRAGTTYVLSTQEGFENDSPLVSVIDEGSDLYGFGVGRADVKPKRAGNMYNVWIRTSRSDSATVTVGAREYAASSTNDWSYVGTEPLPAAGASATSGGGVELLALPNTLIDAYHLPLMLGGGTGVQDLPAGNYRAVSLGTENPGVVSVTRAKDDVVQSIEFIGTEGAFASRKKLIHDASPVTLSPTKQWPQRIVLFESIDDLETSPGTLSGTLLQLLDGTSFAEKNSTKARKDIANATQGLFLFDPFQRGIGPVTMGTQGTETFADHARTTFDDAYMVMRYGRASDPACDENTDPSCDRRKWIREPDVFRTVDSLSPRAAVSGRAPLGRAGNPHDVGRIRARDRMRRLRRSLHQRRRRTRTDLHIRSRRRSAQHPKHTRIIPAGDVHVAQGTCHGHPARDVPGNATRRHARTERHPRRKNSSRTRRIPDARHVPVDRRVERTRRELDDRRDPRRITRVAHPNQPTRVGRSRRIRGRILARRGTRAPGAGAEIARSHRPFATVLGEAWRIGTAPFGIGGRSPPRRGDAMVRPQWEERIARTVGRRTRDVHPRTCGQGRHSADQNENLRRRRRGHDEGRTETSLEFSDGNRCRTVEIRRGKRIPHGKSVHAERTGNPVAADRRIAPDQSGILLTFHALTMHPVRYSIVFPCHNEAPHIERLLRKAELAFAPLDHEIIVVADGCSDGTERVVRAFARHAPSVRLVTSSQRLGKGGAIRKGIAESRGEFVGFMDGDGEIDPSFMLVGFRTLAAGATDIVIGNRYGQGGSYRTTLSRHLTSRVYQAAIWILFGLQFHDTQAGMKAFTATAAKKLFAASNVDGYAFDIDVLMHAHWMGYRIEEVPMQQRFKGTSTISFKHVLEMIADTCGTYDRHARELRATGVAWYRIPTVLRSYAFYPFTSALEFALRAVIHKGR